MYIHIHIRFRSKKISHHIFFFSELESTMKQMESESKELTSIKRDLEFAESEKATKMKDFEKQTKTLKLEKEDLARDLTDAQEKLKLQSKELKDALQQRKLAMSEYTEVTDKYVIYYLKFIFTNQFHRKFN